MRFIKPRDESGQAMVEFALTIGLLILLVAGLIDFGRAFQAYIVIDNAAREGAIAAANSSQCGNYQSVAQTAAINESASSGVILATSNITATASPSCASGNIMQVEVGYSVPLLVGVVMQPITGHNYIRLNYKVRMDIF